MYGASVTIHHNNTEPVSKRAKRTLKLMGKALKDFGVTDVKGTYYQDFDDEPSSAWVILPEGQEDAALEFVRQAMLVHEPGATVEKILLVYVPVAGVAYGSTPHAMASQA